MERIVQNVLDEGLRIAVKLSKFHANSYKLFANTANCVDKRLEIRVSCAKVLRKLPMPLQICRAKRSV